MNKQKARLLLRELETQKKKAPRIRSKRKKKKLSLFARHVSQNGGTKDDVAHCGKFLFYFTIIDIDTFYHIVDLFVCERYLNKY